MTVFSAEAIAEATRYDFFEPCPVAQRPPDSACLPPAGALRPPRQALSSRFSFGWRSCGTGHARAGKSGAFPDPPEPRVFEIEGFDSLLNPPSPARPILWRVQIGQRALAGQGAKARRVRSHQGARAHIARKLRHRGP